LLFCLRQPVHVCKQQLHRRGAAGQGRESGPDIAVEFFGEPAIAELNDWPMSELAATMACLNSLALPTGTTTMRDHLTTFKDHLGGAMA
jgi:hypothetical protein